MLSTDFNKQLSKIKNFMKNILLSLLVMTFWVTTSGQSLKHKDILFYTRNGKGYIHNNIPAAANCFDSLSKVYGFN
jgi:hypothetical protein